MRARSLLLLVAAALPLLGCDEVMGRRKLQQANGRYREGDYQGALRLIQEAEGLVPHLPVLWLNKGYTCRQIMIPGSTTPESQDAAKCATEAFKRMQELAPHDNRGELLYQQTLFDANQFEELAKIYEERFRQNPTDLDAVNGLTQVYSRWNRIDQALEWYMKKAELQADNAESQYAVGVFIWQQLFQRGGGPDKSAFDPRPDPNRPRQKKIPPPFIPGDIVGQQRVDLAERGVAYLKKALELRPTYHEAMTYVNLLYRQLAMAYFDFPEDWQKAIDIATEWRNKSLAAQGKPIPGAGGAGGGALSPLDAPGLVDEPQDDDEEAAGGVTGTKAQTGAKVRGRSPRKPAR